MVFMQYKFSLIMDKELSVRLREVLSRMEITQISFAKRIGLTKNGLEKMLNQDSLPSYNTLRKLKLAFPSIDLNWLLTGLGESISLYQKSLFLNDAEEKYIVKKCDNVYCNEEKARLKELIELLTSNINHKKKENLLLSKELLELTLKHEDLTDKEKEDITNRIKAIKKELL